MNLAKLIAWISLQDYVFETWNRFRGELASVLLVSIGVGVIIIVVVYHRSAKELKISRPADPFRPFAPLRALWLALVPAIVAVVVQSVLYHKILGPHVPFNELVWSFLAVGGLTALLSMLMIAWFPRVTPAKFRYHPRLVARWLWSRRRG